MYFLDRLDLFYAYFCFYSNFWSDLSGHFKFSCFCIIFCRNFIPGYRGRTFCAVCILDRCKLWQGRFYIYQCCYIVYRCGFDIFDCYSTFKRAFHAFCRSGYFVSTCLVYIQVIQVPSGYLVLIDHTVAVLYFYGFWQNRICRNAFAHHYGCILKLRCIRSVTRKFVFRTYGNGIGFQDTIVTLSCRFDHNVISASFFCFYDQQCFSAERFAVVCVFVWIMVTRITVVHRYDFAAFYVESDTVVCSRNHDSCIVLNRSFYKYHIIAIVFDVRSVCGKFYLCCIT